MTTVPAVLLAAALAMGVVPGFGALVARSVGPAGSGGAHWTAHGVLLGVASTALAVALAGLAVTRPDWTAAPGWAAPLRRLQSGHVGDYVAWLLVGTTVLGALALPGVLGS